jgi:hypothetical protein
MDQEILVYHIKKKIQFLFCIIVKVLVGNKLDLL